MKFPATVALSVRVVSAGPGPLVCAGKCACAIVAAKAVSGKVGCTDGTEQIPQSALRQTNDMAAKTGGRGEWFLDWVFSLARGRPRSSEPARVARHDQTGDTQ